MPRKFHSNVLAPPTTAGLEQPTCPGLKHLDSRTDFVTNSMPPKDVSWPESQPACWPVQDVPDRKGRLGIARQAKRVSSRGSSVRARLRRLLDCWSAPRKTGDPLCRSAQMSMQLLVFPLGPEGKISIQGAHRRVEGLTRWYASQTSFFEMGSHALRRRGRKQDLRHDDKPRCASAMMLGFTRKPACDQKPAFSDAQRHKTRPWSKPETPCERERSVK